MNDTQPDAVTGEDMTIELLAVLRRRLDRPELDYAEPPTRLGGGFWAEIFAVRFSGAPPELSGELVARLMPDELFGRRETVVQREVAAQGFPAPTVRLSGDGTDGLGRAYMLMDRSPGVPLMSGLTATRAITSIPRLIRQLPRLLAGTTLELHLLDSDPVAAALRSEIPDAPVDAGDMLDGLATSAYELDSVQLINATAWLAAHRPVPERVCVCHGDLHPFNLLVHDGDQVTLVDWTASRIAEPAFDLAFTTLMMCEAPVDVPVFVAPVIRRAARWLAGRVLSTYRNLAAPHAIAVDEDRLAWYTALHCVRILNEVGWWEAAGETRRHAGHPFLGMHASLETQLAKITSR
jgi:aminoglycoside phosphotransferase (APT) family kinase protein